MFVPCTLLSVPVVYCLIPSRFLVLFVWYLVHLIHTLAIIIFLCVFLCLVAAGGLCTAQDSRFEQFSQHQ